MPTNAHAPNPTADIARFYDSGLGPNMFAGFAELIAGICVSEPVAKALELAAGTGIVSRALRDKLPDDATLTITDFNPLMLDVARPKFEASERVTFKPADAMDLPFEDAAFDAVLCQFGVMFFPDKRSAYSEAHRVLRPGGRFVFNCWNSMAENPFSRMAKSVAARHFPDKPPQFYDMPFSYNDHAMVRSDLAKSGWKDVTHEVHQITRVIENPREYALGLVYGNPLIHEIQARPDLDPESIVSEMQDAIHEWFGPDDLKMPLSATTFTCRKSLP